MNANIQALISACQRLGVTYRVLHPDGNLVSVTTPGGDRLFANWTTPLTDQATARLCGDKDYAYTVLSQTVRMPRTKAFLNPQVDESYQAYVHCPSLEHIATDIDFQFPVILKRNRGSHGSNVFKVDDSTALRAALVIIFDQHSKHYDYVALAQEYIEITAEYRAVFLLGQLIFAYLKDTRAAEYIGNLSPFRWSGSRAVLESDPDQLARLSHWVMPCFQQYSIPYAGVDVAIDPQGVYWILELNSAPGFHFLVRDGGRATVEHLYERILLDGLGCISAKGSETPRL
jgi:glutathione synthase/RimK-type ligase-like ATP-grasp enzyme